MTVKANRPNLLAPARELLQELFPSVQQEAIDASAAQGWRLESASSCCWRCGFSAGRGAVTQRGCSACLNQRLPWSRLVRLGSYDPPLSSWILAMKFQHQWAWSRLLGRWLAERLPALAGPVVVTAVPMHWRRRCQRGYNQADLLAQAVAAAGGLPYAALLRRVQLTPPQTDLPPEQRRRNVRGSFAARNLDLRGWNVWLVDDVKTTGATLSQCARLLRRMGAQSVNVAVAAVAVPRSKGFEQVDAVGDTNDP